MRAGASCAVAPPRLPWSPRFRPLVHLIRHRDHVVSRDELIEVDLGRSNRVQSALSTRINAVRNAVGDSGAEQRLIKTLPRKGVRFVGEVREERNHPMAARGRYRKAAASRPSRCPGNVELPQRQNKIDSHSQALSAPMPAPPGRRVIFLFPERPSEPLRRLRHFYLRKCWRGVISRDPHESERTRTKIETAAKLTTHRPGHQYGSREDYEAAR